MNALRSHFAVVAMSLSIGNGALFVSRAAAEPAPFAQKTFASPEEAIAALRAAVYVHDKNALRDIFGPELHELLTGDEAQDRANSKKFAAAIDEGAKPVSEGDARIILEIGNGKWPFPIPLVKESSVWRFDTNAGKDEIVNRHIGKDELHAIGLCRAYATAQKQREGTERDSIRAKVAAADVNGARPKPFHGYFFKILTRQDAAGGFALAAYPEHWGRSGIMTFIVNQDGQLYQRDLGEKTSQLAAAMAEYNPDGSWTPVKDLGVLEK